jgi:hypothetical protein
MMPSSNNTLNTLYGPYRTPDAVRRAPNADFIPLDGDQNINAVHPIPVDWLREELLPRQRERVREHVAAQIRTLNARDYAYSDALQATMANLDVINGMSTAPRVVPSRHPAGSDVDRLADEFGNLTTGQSQSVHSPPRGVRFAPEVQTERVPRDFRVSDPHSPEPSSPPPRSILRSPAQVRGHSRTASASATMGITALPECNVREPSPTAGLLDDLAALDVQLDEIHVRVNDPFSPQGAIRDRRNTNVATVRSNIRRLRGLRSLTREDVDTTRAGVHSVMSAAGHDEVELAAERDDGPRGGRGGRVRPTSNVPSGMSEQIRLATYQQQQRDHAYAIGGYPVWRSPPVDPQRGDRFKGLDGEIWRFNSRDVWALHNDEVYGRVLFYCD